MNFVANPQPCHTLLKAQEALRPGALASAILWFEVAVQTDLERPDGWEMLGYGALPSLAANTP